MEKNLEILVEKFLRHELNTAEALELETLLKDTGNLEIFREQVEINFLVHRKQKQFDPDAGYSKVQQALKRKDSVTWKPLLKYAAILVVCLGLAFLFFNRGLIT